MLNSTDLILLLLSPFFSVSRFQRFGIYVVMFREICQTLLSIIVIFVYLILAFALAFYALMIEQVRVYYELNIILKCQDQCMSM